MSGLSELQDGARRLVGHVTLEETRLFGINIQHTDFPDGEHEVGLGALSLELQVGRAEETLSYILIVRTALEESLEEDSTKTLAEIEVAYGARYEYDREDLHDITEDEARSFGFAVAVMTIWPFLRAVIANNVREMNVATFALIPTLSQADVASAAQTATTSNDEAAEADER